jgi:hypothetical protein
MYLKIVDHPNLVRDTESKAILNVDRMAKDKFLKARELKRKEAARIDAMEAKMESIENLLKKVLDKLG